MLEKDKIYEVEVFDMSFEGKGTAKIDDMVVFVDNAVIGDIVKVKLTKIKKRYAFGRITDVVKKSDHRVKPDCIYYNRCGGCNVLHVDYETQAKIKLDKVRSTLRGANVDKSKVTCIKEASTQFGYRNKYYVQALKFGASYRFGHFQENTNELVDTDKCLLADDYTNELVNKFAKVVNNLTFDSSIKNIMVRTNRDKSEYLVCLVFKNKKNKDYSSFIKACENEPKLKGLIFNYNFDYKGDILGRNSETVYGVSYLYDNIGDYKFKVEYNAFFQVNSEQAKVLYDEIINLGDFKKTDTVIDAYCGTGTIGIYIADKVNKVIGIEVVESAIKNANENKVLNNVENIEFIYGSVENEIEKVIDANTSTVILDPPRKGCDNKVLDVIAENNIENIIYVSCKTESLVRDLKYLQEKGYDLVEATAVDMFVNSIHVECVAKIVKVK